MRRLTRRDDRGVVAIVIVILLPLLLIAGSLTLDGARGYVAAAQSQSAADAAALAKATDCANGITSTNLSDYATNGTALVGSPTCGTTSATATMSKKVTLGFATPFMSCPGNVCVISRSATASWGSINSATTIPAVISACVVDIATSNETVFPSTVQVIPIGGGATNCPGRPPGNFGWLNVTPANSCQVTTTLTSSGSVTAPGSNGNGSGQPYGCINGASGNGSGYGSDLLFPIYTAMSGTGTNVTYTISGYAEFYVTGWDFQNGPQPKKYPSGGLPSCTSHDCIQGQFIKVVTGQGSTGPGSYFGATTVHLSQ